MLRPGLKISGILPEAKKRGAGSKMVWQVQFQVYTGRFPWRKKLVIWRIFMLALD